MTEAAFVVERTPGDVGLGGVFGGTEGAEGCEVFVGDSPVALVDDAEINNRLHRQKRSVIGTYPRNSHGLLPFLFLDERRLEKKEGGGGGGGEGGVKLTFTASISAFLEMCPFRMSSPGSAYLSSSLFHVSKTFSSLSPLNQSVTIVQAFAGTSKVFTSALVTTPKL